MAEVTSRYARALADVVIDRKLIPGRIREQVSSIAQLVAANANLRNVWDNPSVPSEQKKKLLDAIGQRTVLDPMVRNFIAVLIDHDRIGMIDIIARQFELELDAQLGIAEAKITSSRDLTTDERLALENQIKLITGKSVRSSYATDKGLIGGAVVQIGSTIYDGSVRGQLSRIRETLSAE
ncbi:MAG TPA: ATP synthase F1 subunit delta [Terriglobales bacterium]|nr:ATP synthase F1 subunit delta [Terriglobales bacterium]